ncbi:hypothetical protein, partial [Kocuria salsicia]|uniref:hypothetical protein n=1 Tax=Kocuria salsicia TaxID=664639 RepID=UPI001C92CE61
MMKKGVGVCGGKVEKWWMNTVVEGLMREGLGGGVMMIGKVMVGVGGEECVGGEWLGGWVMQGEIEAGDRG